MNLDVVDLTSPSQAMAKQIARACETVGFFRIPIESVGLDVADAAWNLAAEFFALPDAEKRVIEFPEPGYPYGYSPYQFETLAKSVEDGSSAGPDLKESLSVGPDCSGIEVTGDDQTWIRSPSIWPARPFGLREAWTAYYRALANVSEQLMSAMAVALELPADYFDPMIDRPITSMRAIHYPALAEAPSGSSIRAGAHSDYGTLTILRTDDVSGLQIRGADGEWSDVDPEPGTFVVNLGDSIAQWTNDRWRSTVHRVALTDQRQRQSFAFFHMANWDATIECLPTCVEPGRPPRHRAVEAGPWLMRKFQSTVT